MDDKVLASGELLQVTEGRHLRSRLTFQFRDGSVDDETTIFRQDSVFHLLSDHHVQKGPSFPHPMDVTIDVAHGKVTRKQNAKGKEKDEIDSISMPPDLSNGLILDIIKNFPRNSQAIKISMLVSAPKPRVVKLAIAPEKEDKFFVAGAPHKAQEYLIKIEIGGITGAIAPMIGKKPLDVHVWMAEGAPSTMIRTESQFFADGPLWRVELCGPSWR
jgi:hypothetical protein